MSVQQLRSYGDGASVLSLIRNIVMYREIKLTRRHGLSSYCEKKLLIRLEKYMTKFSCWFCIRNPIYMQIDDSWKKKIILANCCLRCSYDDNLETSLMPF